MFTIDLLLRSFTQYLFISISLPVSTRLFHDQIILYVFSPFFTACDFVRFFITRLYRIKEAAQLHQAFKCLDTDLEWLETIICCKLRPVCMMIRYLSLPF
jgi:hypothetical protein